MLAGVLGGLVLAAGPTGVASAAPVTANYSSGNIGVAIPDATATGSPGFVENALTVADVGQVTDVNVRVRIDHTFDRDLVVTLVGPDGTVAALTADNGAAENDYGTGADTCSGTFTVFDDAAATAISATTAPFAGTFRPESPLSVFNGKASNGTWKLQLSDRQNVDTGTLFCWQLDITRKPPADLSIAKTDAPDPVVLGQNASYTLTATNNGPSATTGVVVTDTLPAGTTFVSATPSAGSCSQASGVVTCPIGSLASGASATVTIVVTPTAEGGINNTATVASDDFDTNTANNTASAATSVRALVTADLSLVKTDRPDPVRVGRRVTYTLTVKNDGPAAASGVEVIDALPAGARYVSAKAGAGTCVRKGTLVTCSIGNLASGGSVKITIVVRPTARGSIYNFATVAGDQSDPNRANNRSQTRTRVR